MKIAKVETFVHKDFPNIFHIEISTDTGLTGLGEGYYFGASIAHFVEAFVGRAILGKDPRSIEDISKFLTTYVGHNGSGIETRARAAVDIALWDLAGKIANKPLYELLGGKEVRPLPTYNTCAGRMYMRKSNQGSSAWGLDALSDKYEDLKAFMDSPAELALDLLGEGITAMKVWPFDVYAEKNWGVDISDEDLNSGIQVIKRIRDAAGDKMKIMIELHALWSPLAAKKIMEGLIEYQVFWVEDPIYPDLVDEYQILRGKGMPKIAHGETIASLSQVKTLINNNLIDYLTLDIGWCGGITQALTFAKVAKQGGVQIAPHDCTGPVGLMVGAHLSTADSNAIIQETVRSSYRTWYPHLVEGLPNIQGSEFSVNKTPGHGLSLSQTFKDSADMQRTVI